MKNNFLTRRRLIKCSLSTCEKAQEIKVSPWIESKDIYKFQFGAGFVFKKEWISKRHFGRISVSEVTWTPQKGVKRKTLLDSVFLKGNRGHLSENLSTKNTALIWWIHQYQIGAFFTSSEKLKKALKPQKETRWGKNADGQQTKISVECGWPIWRMRISRRNRQRQGSSVGPQTWPFWKAV